jgi:hypothetical protein
MRHSQYRTGGSPVPAYRSAITAWIASSDRPPALAIRTASSRFGSTCGASRAYAAMARRSSWSRESFQCPAIAAMNRSPIPRSRLTTSERCADENLIERASSACSPGRIVSWRTLRTTYSATILRRFSASIPLALTDRVFTPASALSPCFLACRGLGGYHCTVRSSPRFTMDNPRLYCGFFAHQRTVCIAAEVSSPPLAPVEQRQ